MVVAVRIAQSSSTRARNLLRAIQYSHPPTCPCHSNPIHHHSHAPLSAANHATRSLATPVERPQKEYAFQMAASNIRFGPGCTKEVGMDFKNMGSKRVMIVTDSTVAKLDAMKQVVEGLDSEGIKYEVFQKVRVEPKDTS